VNAEQQNSWAVTPPLLISELFCAGSGNLITIHLQNMPCHFPCCPMLPCGSELVRSPQTGGQSIHPCSAAFPITSLLYCIGIWQVPCGTSAAPLTFSFQPKGLEGPENKERNWCYCRSDYETCCAARATPTCPLASPITLAGCHFSERIEDRRTRGFDSAVSDDHTSMYDEL